MNSSDLHTHTVFSDGLNTMEEMVRAAEAKVFSSIGFSDHSFTDFDRRYCIREEQLPQYHAEIRRLKEAYAGRIEVYAGWNMTVSRSFRIEACMTMSLAIATM